MASLTKSQQLVYDYLCSTMAERAVPPSVREICAATGLRSTSTVHSHLKSLEALVYITRDAGLNRSFHIVGASAAKQVPILGKVPAGLPILAVEDIEGYIPYPDKSGKELFALHVDGLSMINAGILDGDYVIAEETPVEETAAEPTYTVSETLTRPVPGEVMTEFSDTPVYSETMRDYRVHAGTDYTAAHGETVHACANGIVKETHTDMLRGNMIVIEHGDYEVRYCGLGETFLVHEGDVVTAGQDIGSVTAAPFESALDSHLHIEVTRNGEPVDPESVFG